MTAPGAIPALSRADKALLVKALGMAASRLEAYGRSYPRTARRHEVAARDMRDLRRRLLQAPVVEESPPGAPQEQPGGCA